jgi:hypothetical protein
MTIREPFKTAFYATFGVLLALLVFVSAGLLLVEINGDDMGAVSVRAVCAMHDGVLAVDDDNGLVLPTHLVVCRDGYVGEPTP